MLKEVEIFESVFPALKSFGLLTDKDLDEQGMNSDIFIKRANVYARTEQILNKYLNEYAKLI